MRGASAIRAETATACRRCSLKKKSSSVTALQFARKEDTTLAASLSARKAERHP